VIILPFPPYSANHAYLIISRTIGRKKVPQRIPKKETKAYWNKIGWIVKEQIREPYERLSELRYAFYWPDNRVRDFDNHVKIVADGLKGVLFRDDSWQCIGQKSQRTEGIDRDNPRVIVEWEE
jgi:Holliday junction resolvase RusA-like endonuclease